MPSKSGTSWAGLFDMHYTIARMQFKDYTTRSQEKMIAERFCTTDTWYAKEINHRKYSMHWQRDASWNAPRKPSVDYCWRKTRPLYSSYSVIFKGAALQTPNVITVVVLHKWLCFNLLYWIYQSMLSCLIDNNAALKKKKKLFLSLKKASNNDQINLFLVFTFCFLFASVAGRIGYKTNWWRDNQQETKCGVQ